MNVCIIGGGVAGLTYALSAAALHPLNRYTIFEKSTTLAARILISGSGRCNIINESFLTSDRVPYLSKNSLFELEIKKSDKENLRDFFKKLKLAFYTDEEGRVYPFSNNAKSVEEAFLNELKNHHNISVRYSSTIRSIDPLKKEISLINQTITYDELVIASGGLSHNYAEETFSSASILECFKEQLTPFVPALGPIKVNFSWPKKLINTRVRGHLTCYYHDRVVYEEDGEMLFKEKQLSGIMIYNVSLFNLIYKKDLVVEVDFAKYKNQQADPKTPETYLYSKLQEAFLELPISDSTLRFKVLQGPSFKESQVTSGGIKLEALDLDTMRLLAHKDIIVLGEATDLTGFCGGYNIGWALISALRAAKN